VGDALVVAVIPEEYMMPGFLRIRRGGKIRPLLEVYKEEHPEDDKEWGPPTHKLLEMYPDAFFSLAFRPDENVWQLPGHEPDPGWWQDKEEVARYSQEDVGGSLKEFLNKKLDALRHMIRMPGRWLLGSIQVTEVTCEAAGDDVGVLKGFSLKRGE
jgi:hypothetical protein